MSVVGPQSSAPVDVLVLIHGMVPDREPSSRQPVYDAFWAALKESKPQLDERIKKVVCVEWGHELPTDGSAGRDQRNDHRLTRAQSYIHGRVAYDVIQQTPGPNNIIMSGVLGSDYSPPGIHYLAKEVREKVALFGLGDVVYYCSTDGEKQVRSVVYDQVLDALDQYKEARNVRLHLFAHSLGVTIAHDFLYGLFAPDITPSFATSSPGSSPEERDSADCYARWRRKAQDKQLKLGSLATAASQLPLLVMRKQALVDRLFREERLDPSVIGIEGDQVKWKVFYDIDDLLGFATRGLYRPDELIMDIQVDVGTLPSAAHTGYWTNSTVIEETADLICSNSQ